MSLRKPGDVSFERAGFFFFLVLSFFNFCGWNAASACFDRRTRLPSGPGPAFAWMRGAACVAQVWRGGTVGLPGGGRERGEGRPVGQLLLMEG